jgi:hypothetical protein
LPYLVENVARLPQTGEALLQHRHLLVGAGPKDVPEHVERALVPALPEVGARDGDAWARREILQSANDIGQHAERVAKRGSE